MSARNRAASPGGGGGLFGPEGMARLALDPRGRELLDDAEFMGVLRQAQARPEMINAFLQDKRMQLVRGGRGGGGGGGGGVGGGGGRGRGRVVRGVARGDGR
jgi:hypothetical protein